MRLATAVVMPSCRLYRLVRLAYVGVRPVRPVAAPAIVHTLAQATMSVHLDADDPGAVSFQIDLLRGDLYRMLDEIVRARGDEYRDLVAQFERTWRDLKAAKGLPVPGEAVES